MSNEPSSFNVDEPRRLSPAEALPPVEPPGVGFIVQLFVIPAAMVVIIVGVWLAFHWLAQKGANPLDDIEALERAGHGRWQAAVNLASALSGPGHEDLKRDSAAAQRLAKLLTNELERSSVEPEDQQLRYFLCRALGEFKVADVVPPLCTAAALSERDEETTVAALEALAIWCDHRVELTVEQSATLAKALQVATRADQPRIQSAATFALGVEGSPEALERLEFLLGSAHPDVRYNAALGLARNGNGACLDVLREMLDVEQVAAAQTELDEASKGFKRSLVQMNALRAVQSLREKTPGIDVSGLQEEVAKLADSATVAREVRVRAEELLIQLAEDAPAGPTE